VAVVIVEAVVESKYEILVSYRMNVIIKQSVQQAQTDGKVKNSMPLRLIRGKKKIIMLNSHKFKDNGQFKVPSSARQEDK